MRRQDFSKLCARLDEFRRDFLNQRSVPGGTTGKTSSSPVLTFIAAALFLILAIIEIDLHRKELRALGLIISEVGVDPTFVGP